MPLEDFNFICKFLQKNYIDIHRILYNIDPAEAEFFKNRNSYFHEEKHKKKNKKHDHSTQDGLNKTLI